MDPQSQKIQTIDEGIFQRALGCVLGACCGDAVGAAFEGIDRPPTEQEVEIGFTFPGGGKHRVAPGQITDDGELTISLLTSLASSESGWNIEQNASYYADWAKSKPFDMGITCGASIGCVMKGEHNKAFRDHLHKVGYAYAMKAAAKYDGNTSKSNGSLMRCTPIGVYGYRMSDSEIAQMAIEDSSLSHSNTDVGDAVACYCIGLAELIQSGDRIKAFNRAMNWASNANQEIFQWMKEAEQNIKEPFWPSAGFIKIGFTHAFRHLLLGSDYKTAMRETLLGGGDTDTNCCIVGGMIGAAVGVNAIPEHFAHTVYSCDTKAGRPRPETLHPKHIPDFVEKIITSASSSLVIIKK